MAHHTPIKVVFLDRDTIPAHITLPTLRHPHHWQSYPATAPGDVIDRLQHADVAITNKVVINEAILTECH
jgi:glycerate dehydrogenase